MKQIKILSILMSIVLAMVLFSAGALVTGCTTQAMTAWYGPDMTPDEMKGELYKEAYGFGSLRRSQCLDKVKDIADEKLKAEKLQAYLDEYDEKVQAVIAATDTDDYLLQQWLEAIRSGDQQSILIWTAARKLYSRVGAKIVNDQLDTSGVDLNLTHYAANAYLDGLYGRMENL
jgi:hypothetical protein